MPVINGIKMACAACIRGHRSTTCQHTDRPLLEVRKKGRPMTQCNHCRELRKVKQVHVRCACKPDESEAPKRSAKGKEKRGPQTEPPDCRCDDSGVCVCATPRNATTHHERRLSTPSMPCCPKPELPKRNRSCVRGSSCSHADSPDSQCSSCSSDTASTSQSSGVGSSIQRVSSRTSADTSPPSSCCVSPATPQDLQACPNWGKPSPFAPPPPPSNETDTPSSLSSKTPAVDPLWPEVNTQPSIRSHRYHPYAQVVTPTTQLSAFDDLFGPSPSSQELTSTPSTALNSDSAFWEQFLRPSNEQANIGSSSLATSSVNPLPILASSNLLSTPELFSAASNTSSAPSNPQPTSSNSPLVPPPNCACFPCETHAKDPVLLAECAETGTCDRCFDCSALRACITSIEGECPAQNALAGAPTATDPFDMSVPTAAATNQFNIPSSQTDPFDSLLSQPLFPSAPTPFVGELAFLNNLSSFAPPQPPSSTYTSQEVTPPKPSFPSAMSQMLPLNIPSLMASVPSNPFQTLQSNGILSQPAASSSQPSITSSLSMNGKSSEKCTCSGKCTCFFCAGPISNSNAAAPSADCNTCTKCAACKASDKRLEEMEKQLLAPTISTVNMCASFMGQLEEMKARLKEDTPPSDIADLGII